MRNTVCAFLLLRHRNLSKRNKSQTHDKNDPTNEHTNQQNAQRRNDREYIFNT